MGVDKMIGEGDQQGVVGQGLALGCLAPDWTLKAAGQHLAERSGVDMDAWMALARVFTEVLSTTDAACQD